MALPSGGRPGGSVCRGNLPGGGGPLSLMDMENDTRYKGGSVSHGTSRAIEGRARRLSGRSGSVRVVEKGGRGGDLGSSGVKPGAAVTIGVAYRLLTSLYVERQCYNDGSVCTERNTAGFSRNVSGYRIK